MEICTLNSCYVCMKILEKNLFLSTGEMLCFSSIMQGHINQEKTQEKILNLGWSVDSIHHINQTLH